METQAQLSALQEQIFSLMANEIGVGIGMLVIFIALISIWSIIWKGIALWKAARLSHKGWFIALLLINTMGILEIIYIYFIANKEEAKDAGESESI